MTALNAIRCKACGGTVRAAPGKVPSCLFCGAGAASLEVVTPSESVEEPVGAIPFVVDEARAREAFSKFAGSSWWYPSDLRSSKLELKRLLLPAWAWNGTLEVHWAGLVPSATRAGKRPTAGRETVTFDQVLVPSSPALKLAELRALGRYDETALAPFSPESAADPYEVGTVTRSMSKTQAYAEMQARYRQRLINELGLVKANLSAVAPAMDGRPVLVPVYIGAYRYGNGVYRVLVNGQDGVLHGTAPTSVWKVLLVIALSIAALGALTLLILVCLGVAAGAH
jgi:hypothetical protein